MTREEERINASVAYNEATGKLRVVGGDNILSKEEYIIFNKNLSFIAGAEWSDEHPKEGLVSIDKVVDWLRDNFHSYEIADTGYGHVESLNFMNTEVMIEDFLETIKK